HGVTASGFHLTNLVLHVANSVLLFMVLFRLTGSPWPSAFVSALFAWHPLHVESVAWIAERKDVLSGLFFMLTLFCYAGYGRMPDAGRQKAEGRYPAPGISPLPSVVWY